MPRTHTCNNQSNGGGVPFPARRCWLQAAASSIAQVRVRSMEKVILRLVRIIFSKYLRKHQFYSAEHDELEGQISFAFIFAHVEFYSLSSLLWHQMTQV